ncbi:alpha-N-acetylgalactosaminide alpha-2,6-sialyltransferase 2 isoform X2 [Microcaecilia unicolor]|uniref:alpha-N-acetylgalactosaminide alpha-2,6-sialyltransferase n=1 Tax=Microcaecilia unicolor TaxID=1415580 RepID=A0A6P7YHL7_9AMPH|nr:alpha-N-acetylgalactosaminide alpha-2,6-sialyltransferase 2-like isoform X2 [Microcaecilia unicolor]
MALCFRVRTQKLKWGALTVSCTAMLLFLFWSLELSLTDQPRAGLSPRQTFFHWNFAASHKMSNRFQFFVTESINKLKIPHHEHKVDREQKKTLEARNGKAAVGVHPVPRLEPQPTTTHRRLTTADMTIRFLDQGDEYGEDITYLKLTCPDSIRERIARTELQSSFLSMIPVLQWKKHATQEEYKRLRKYKGAQGWKEVDWHILNETLNLLNSSANGYLFDDWQQRRSADSSCIRCAVVGNGGILNGSKVGAEIDQHDYVFRVNAAILKGFEEDVGNRTSFYGFSSNTMLNSLIAYFSDGFVELPKSMETRYIFVPDHEQDYLLLRAALTHTVVKKLYRPSRLFGQNLRTEKFKILHPDFMRYLRNRFLWDPILNTEDRDIYRVSTGAAMLLAAIHTCDQLLGSQPQHPHLIEEPPEQYQELQTRYIWEQKVHTFEVGNLFSVIYKQAVWLVQAPMSLICPVSSPFDLRRNFQ